MQIDTRQPAKYKESQKLFFNKQEAQKLRTKKK